MAANTPLQEEIDYALVPQPPTWGPQFDRVIIFSDSPVGKERHFTMWLPPRVRGIYGIKWWDKMSARERKKLLKMKFQTNDYFSVYCFARVQKGMPGVDTEPILTLLDTTYKALLEIEHNSLAAYKRMVARFYGTLRTKFNYPDKSEGGKWQIQMSSGLGNVDTSPEEDSDFDDNPSDCEASGNDSDDDVEEEAIVAETPPVGSTVTVVADNGGFPNGRDEIQDIRQQVLSNVMAEAENAMLGVSVLPRAVNGATVVAANGNSSPQNGSPKSTDNRVEEEEQQQQGETTSASGAPSQQQQGGQQSSAGGGGPPFQPSRTPSPPPPAKKIVEAKNGGKGKKSRKDEKDEAEEDRQKEMDMMDDSVADSNFSPGEEDTDSSDDSDAEAASETRRQKQKTKTLPKRLAPLRDVAARHRKKGEAKAEKMTVQVRYNLATKLEGSERENILHLFNALKDLHGSIARNTQRTQAKVLASMSDRIDDLTTLTRALVKQSDLDEQKILQEQAEEDYREMPTGGLPLKTVEELDQFAKSPEAQRDARAFILHKMKNYQKTAQGYATTFMFQWIFNCSLKLAGSLYTKRLFYLQRLDIIMVVMPPEFIDFLHDVIGQAKRNGATFEETTQRNAIERFFNRCRSGLVVQRYTELKHFSRDPHISDANRALCKELIAYEDKTFERQTLESFDLFKVYRETPEPPQIGPNTAVKKVKPPKSPKKGKKKRKSASDDPSESSKGAKRQMTKSAGQLHGASTSGAGLVAIPPPESRSPSLEKEQQVEEVRQETEFAPLSTPPTSAAASTNTARSSIANFFSDEDDVESTSYRPNLTVNEFEVATIRKRVNMETLDTDQYPPEKFADRARELWAKWDAAKHMSTERATIMIKLKTNLALRKIVDEIIAARQASMPPPTVAPSAAGSSPTASDSGGPRTSSKSSSGVKSAATRKRATSADKAKKGPTRESPRNLKKKKNNRGRR